MLEIKNLSVSYGREEIIHSVSFSILPRETVSIVGESGSGKSTLLKAILGLMGQEGHITGGMVWYKGQDLSSLSKEEMRKLRGNQIGMVYQQAGRSMDPITKIGRQFHEALCTREKISRRESDRRAVECMQVLSLKNPEKILNSYPVMLSGGMNQRVALALAMVMNPRLLLADEPTSALDVTVQVEVLEAMKELKQTCSAAILMVTHNIGVVAQMSDRVGVMYAGYLVEWGTREQILKTPAHPYTRALMKAVLRLGGGFPDAKEIYRAKAPEGCPFYHRCPVAEEICGKKLPAVMKGKHGHQVMCHNNVVLESI